MEVSTSQDPEAGGSEAEPTNCEEPPQAHITSPEKTKDEIVSPNESAEPENEVVAESAADIIPSPEPSITTETEKQSTSPASAKSTEETDSLAPSISQNEPLDEKIEPAVEDSGSHSADAPNESAVELSDKPDSRLLKTGTLESSDVQEASSEETQTLGSKQSVEEAQDKLSSQSDAASLDTVSQNTVEEQKNADASKDAITREPSKTSLESSNEIDQPALETSSSPKADEAGTDSESPNRADDPTAESTKSPVPVGSKEENLENGAGISGSEKDTAEIDSQLPQDGAAQTNEPEAEVSSEVQAAPDGGSENAEESNSHDGSRTTSANADETLRIASPIGENNNEVKIVSVKESPVTNGAIETLEIDPAGQKDELLNASATKIQANVRGYLSRKRQISQQSGKH
ncbi:Hypothetical protein NTJ_03156 [Nesidiocoris tenuis]|uniref:Uncharacterized protein n=1 Tax=Nesidiocoris tenuis TaxID=355587 RepID=A0ABN7AGF0_9HEMI|nr:Hypothetical protein NTJ_03156 [Nesidiocoris tenuis]